MVSWAGVVKKGQWTGDLDKPKGTQDQNEIKTDIKKINQIIKSKNRNKNNIEGPEAQI